MDGAPARPPPRRRRRRRRDAADRDPLDDRPRPRHGRGSPTTERAMPQPMATEAPTAAALRQGAGRAQGAPRGAPRGRPARPRRPRLRRGLQPLGRDRPTGAASPTSSCRPTSGLARCDHPARAPPRSATSAASRRASRSSSLEKCVGCMACVSACPDTAILGDRPARVAGSSRDRRRSPRREPDPALAADDGHVPLRPHHRSTARCPPAQGPRARPRSASSSTRSTARAAPSASRSAHALGHDALVMIDKVAAEAERREHARALRARHALLPVPAADARSSTATRRRWPT